MKKSILNGISIESMFTSKEVVAGCMEGDLIAECTGI